VTTRTLPDAWDLPRPRYSGWACVWCGASLQLGGQMAGRATSSRGEEYAVDVYECLPGHGCKRPRKVMPPG